MTDKNKLNDAALRSTAAVPVAAVDGIRGK
jgi:hypothetical protein